MRVKCVQHLDNSGAQNIGEKGSSRSWHSRWTSIITHVGFWATIIGVFLAAWTIYLTFKVDPDIRYGIVDRQCHTRAHQVEGLESFYRYKGNFVMGFWTISIQLSNESGCNIIGNSSGHLLHNALRFSTEGIGRILKAEVIAKDFEVDAKVCGTNCFEVTFVRWRPKKHCVVRLHCEAADDTCPKVFHCGEQLRSGEILPVEDGISVALPSDHSMLDRLPRLASIVLRWTAIIIYVILSVLILYVRILGVPWYSIWKRKRWEKIYGETYKAARANDNDGESCDYKRDIDKVPEEFWKRHAIPRPIAPIRNFDKIEDCPFDRNDLLSTTMVSVGIIMILAVGLMALIIW